MQLSELIKKDPAIERVAKAEEVIWFNPGLRCRDAAFEGISLTMADIDDAEARLRRFAPFIMRCFPETAGNGGIIESPLTEVEHMRQWLNGHGGGIGGQLQGRYGSIPLPDGGHQRKARLIVFIG